MAATALSRTRRLLDADQLAFLVGHRSREPLPLVADRRAERGREVPGVLRPLRGADHLVRVVYPAHGGDPNRPGDLAVLTGVPSRLGVAGRPVPPPLAYHERPLGIAGTPLDGRGARRTVAVQPLDDARERPSVRAGLDPFAERQSAVEGQRGSVRVDLGVG